MWRSFLRLALGVVGQLHAPITLPPGKEITRVCCVGGWLDLEPWRADNVLACARNRPTVSTEPLRCPAACCVLLKSSDMQWWGEQSLSGKWGSVNEGEVRRT